MWRSITDQLLLPASKEPPQALSAGWVADLWTLQLPLQQFGVWTHSKFPPSSSQRPHFRSLSMYRLSQQQHGVLPNKLLPISIFSPREEESCWQPHCTTCSSMAPVVFQPSSCTANSSQTQGKWEVKLKEHRDRWEQLSGRCGVLATQLAEPGKQRAKGWFRTTPLKPNSPHT